MQKDARLPTEQEVMLAFTEEYKDRLRYNHGTNQWLLWAEHRWRPDNKQRVLNFVLRRCRFGSHGEKPNKISFGRAVETGCRVQEEFATEASDWDANPMLLGCPGGVVDLATGELRDGRPDDMISKATACTPLDHEYCPRWIGFIEEALAGSEPNISYFQRYCGYSLTGLIRENALLFVAGKPGTGKGTATKTLVSILRDYALTVPVTMFTDTGWRALEYYRAQLFGRRLILASEPEKGMTWSDAFVNELTGGDTLSGRHPSGRPFQFDPTHKLAIHGEQVPQLRSVSTGLRRRLAILPFNVTPAQPDPALKDALRAEYPGILRWMLAGCLSWQTIGLAPPPDVTAAVEEYFANQDTIERWIAECCDLLPSARTKPSALLASYNTWAERNFEPRQNYNTLKPDLKRRFGEALKSHGELFYRGVALKVSPQNSERFQ